MNAKDILKLKTQINIKELLCLIDKNTDTDFLISHILEDYFKNEDKTSKFLYDIAETIENILLAISYHFPEKLESTIKKLPLRILNKLRRDIVFDESRQLNKIFNLIENTYKKKINNIKGILPPNIKVIDIEHWGNPAFSQIFDDGQLLLCSAENDSDKFEQLFIVDDLIGISPIPIDDSMLYSCLLWLDDNVNHIEFLSDELNIPKDVISKYVNLKKYPRLRLKKFFRFSINLVAIKKSEFYWLFHIEMPEKLNESSEYIKEKCEFTAELESKFKLQNKKVEFIIGTEEYIIEELKRKFSESK